MSLLKKQILVFCLSLISFLTSPAFAAVVPCNTAHPNNPVFNDGIQTHDVNGKVSFACGSRLRNSPDDLVETSCLGPLTSGCTPPVCSPVETCDPVNCAKNTTTPQVGTMSATFPSFSGGANSTNPGTLAPGTYNTVTLSTGTQTFNCTGCNNSGIDYRIDTLVLNGGLGALRMAPGNYYIKNITFTGTATDDRQIQFNGTGDGSGTIRMFVDNGASPLVMNQRFTIAMGGHANRFILYAYRGVTITDQAVDLEAIIYTPQDAIFQPTNAGTIAILGNVIAKNITMGLNTTQKVDVTYDNEIPTLAGFGPITCNTPATTNHFSLTGISSPATNCSTQNITVTALKSDNSVDTSYLGTIVLSTQGSCVIGSNCTSTCSLGGLCKGTWNTAGGCTNCGSTDGYAEYTFQASDNGARNFTLVYPPEGLTPTSIVTFQKTNSAINGSAGSISFNPSQFIVVESTTAVGAPPAPAGYSTAQVAGTNFSPQVKLVAYATCGSGVASSYTGSKSIRFFSSYINPTPANAAGTNVLVNGTAIARNNVEAATSQNITFTNGVSTLTTVNYADVGNITLTVSDNAVAGMTGSSGNIIVKPFDFTISGTGIPGTSNPSGTIFGKAGQSFAATVTAKASNGAVTGSFGKENVPEGIRLQSASLAAPTGGQNGSDNLGTIGNATTFSFVSPGVYQGSTFTFDEVGSINLRARLSSGSYLGAGDVVGTSVLVGRFQPDHFNVSGNTPQFATGCTSGAFTYLDQPFVYSTAPIMTVIAKAANNPISSNYTTKNYNGSFKKISASQFTAATQDYQPGAISTPAIDKSAANLPLPIENDNNQGTMTYTFAASGGGANQGLKLNRPAIGSTTSPFAANIQLRLTVADTDTTPVIYPSNPFVFSGTGSGIVFNNGANFYQGRLYLSNAFGSEIASLDVPMQAQYYNGTMFTTNIADNCSNISNTANILLTDPLPPATPITTSATLPQPAFIAGASFIRLSAPNASGQKNIEVDLTTTGANLPWLQFNWPFTPAAYGNPHAQANFGTYKGKTDVIYQGETYP